MDQALAAIRLDGDLEIFHRRIEHLGHLTPHGVALVQEQHVALLEHDQDGSQVSRLLDGRRGQLVETGSLLGGDDRRQGGLAQAGAAVEHNVLQGGGPLVGGVEHQPQRLFQVALADELLQRFGAEVPLVGNGITLLGGHK